MAKSYPVPIAVEKVKMGGKRTFRRITVELDFAPEEWMMLRVYVRELEPNLDDVSIWSQACSNAAAAGLRIELARILTDRD